MNKVAAVAVPIYMIIVAIGAFLHANLIYSPLVYGRDALAVAGGSPFGQAAARKDRVIDLQEQIHRRDARIAQLEEANATDIQRRDARIAQLEEANATDIQRRDARIAQLEEAYATDIQRRDARIAQLEEAYATDIQRRGTGNP